MRSRSVCALRGWCSVFKVHPRCFIRFDFQTPFCWMNSPRLVYLSISEALLLLTISMLK